MEVTVNARTPDALAPGIARGFELSVAGQAALRAVLRVADLRVADFVVRLFVAVLLVLLVLLAVMRALRRVVARLVVFVRLVVVFFVRVGIYELLQRRCNRVLDGAVAANIASPLKVRSVHAPRPASCVSSRGS